MRSVPRAERHRIKEIPEEEAYRDWQLRLAREEMEEAECRVQLLEKQREKLMNSWLSSEEFWNGCAAEPERLRHAEACCSEAVEKWQETCERWYDIWAED